MPSKRALIVVGTLAMVLAGLIAFSAVRWSHGPVAWFMPGPLGRARITTPVPLKPSAGGYLTRAIGLSRPEEKTWAKHNGLTPALSFSHHLAEVFPVSLYATHPQFFPLIGGRRLDPPKGSGFWNPDLGRADVARFAARQADRFFDHHPDAVSYSLGINDGIIFGESPATLALVQPPQWFRGRPDYSRLVFTFMNRAAAALAKSHPDKYLGCLAYYWCEDAPPFKVDPHVVPFLTADRSQSYDPAFLRQEFDLQTRWARALGAGKGKAEKRKAEKPKADPKATDAPSGSDVGVSAFQHVSVSPSQRVGVSPPIRPRLGLYDYLDDYGFLVPRVPIHAFAEHIRHAYEVGFTDYYGESSRNWGLDGPLPWVIAQLLQNPEQNVDALLDAYYASYFQEAAGPMRKFFELCESQWMHQTGPSYWLKHYRNESQADLFPPAVRRRLRAYLTEAQKDAESIGGTNFAYAASQHAAILAQRVAFVSDSFGVTERFCALQEARAKLGNALLRGTAAGPALARLLADYLAKRSAFIRYTVQTTERWPLAFYPINYDDFLRDDPTFEATFKLAAADDLAAQNRRRTDSGHGPAAAERSDAGLAAFRRLGIAAIGDAVAGANAVAARQAPEVLPNGGFEGALVPGRRIAGLNYGISLPAPWLSETEPTEDGVAKLRESSHASVGAGRPGSPAASAPRFLHLGGQVDATAYQWVHATGGRLYLASAQTRGRVSSSDRVTLTLGFLDAQQKPVGRVVVMRLPEGAWPRWVTLRQGERAPATAAWVGVGLRIQHQVPGDWADFAKFSLQEADEKLKAETRKSGRPELLRSGMPEKERITVRPRNPW